MSHTIKDIARIAGVDLFEQYGSSYGMSKSAYAEKLTEGKTHYFSSGSRRFHQARVVHLSVLDEGLTLGAVERVALDSRGESFGFRPVFIRADGTVFDRPGLEDCFNTKAAALKEFWRLANLQKPADCLRAILQAQESRAARALKDAKQALRDLSKVKAQK